MERLEESLRDFRSQLPRIAWGDDTAAETFRRLSDQRAKIEADLRRVMSRTERRGRAEGGDPMLDVTDMPADVHSSDVEAYLSAREVARAVDAPGVTEYWKSAPYLLSFMDRYRLAERVRNAVKEEPNGEVAGFIPSNTGLQLRHNLVKRRRRVPGGNGRMRALLQDMSDNHFKHLLWLPPSMPTHALGTDFERARAATKRLVFSSWAMVPRAMAVIGSYDAERRYVPDRERAARYESRLLPVRRDSYSLFALVAPSHTLAEVGDSLRYEQVDARGLLRAIEERLRPRIDVLTRAAPTEGSPQEIWYAVAPLLLDQESGGNMLQWLRGPTGDIERRYHTRASAWQPA